MYGCLGARKICSTDASSTMRPAYMTSTRSHISATTPRSCVMRRIAASVTVRAIGPAVSWLWAIGMIPLRLTSPIVGFIPTRPHAAAGIRIEPPPSEPVAHGTRPAATAAAEPPEDPPGVRVKSQGLRVIPFASVGFIGIYRDKFINNTVEYYFKMPADIKGKMAILCDPLVATADTMVAA